MINYIMFRKSYKIYSPKYIVKLNLTKSLCSSV